MSKELRIDTLRRMCRILKKNKNLCRPIIDGHYLCKCHASVTEQDLIDRDMVFMYELDDGTKVFGSPCL